MKKRMFTTAMAMSMMISLVGCGEKKPEETTPATETTTAAPATTVAPATEAPTTAAPATTAAPVTEAPTTEAPTTEAPTTEAPTQAPTTEAPTQAPAGDFLFTKENYPKVDGATAQYPMSLEIAKAAMGLTQEEAEEFIIHHTTKNAYYNLIDKKVDVIFVSEPSDDILKRAADAGVEFEMCGIGRDGFVFLVNEDNPVDSLTLDQIRDIYTGKITNWKEVGGEDVNICAYQREQNSGSQNLMEKMVMQGEEMMEAPKNYYIESMGGLIDQIASYENSRSSLGYSVYLYAKEQYVRDNVKFLGINGVVPSDETIASGEYPLSKIVYAVYRSDEPTDSPVRKLCNYLLTEEGQKNVVAGGYSGIVGDASVADGKYLVEDYERALFRDADGNVTMQEDLKNGTFTVSCSLGRFDADWKFQTLYPFAVRSFELADDFRIIHSGGTGEDTPGSIPDFTEFYGNYVRCNGVSISIEIKDGKIVEIELAS
ncbi:MAG: substrate-binding domain-containing protein [Lachnospiraceae bacterium]|nr:substrate-binding domain-containing protein [Lachnospiraceae bacterium]